VQANSQIALIWMHRGLQKCADGTHAWECWSSIYEIQNDVKNIITPHSVVELGTHNFLKTCGMNGCEHP